MVVPQNAKLDRHGLRFSVAPAQESQFASLLNCLRRGDRRPETLARIARKQSSFHSHNHIPLPQDSSCRGFGSH